MTSDSQLPRLSLKEKIGQLFMIGFPGTEIPADVREFMETRNIGFAALFTRNVETFPQVKALTAQIHEAAKIRPFIYTDQEGGTIVRFKELAATVVSPMALTATGDPANARTAGRIIGEEMKSLGVDGVLAPVLDVNFEEKNPIIGIRAFSDEPDTVFTYAREFAAGLNDAGTAACAKHYPGHGGTTEDSHLEIPSVSISPEYFFHYCYKPFAEIIRTGIHAVMSSHVLFPHLSPNIATFCPYLIGELLRKKAGYDGVVTSDCLEMLAVKDHYTPEQIVKGAIDAGLDLLAVSHSLDFQKALFDALYFYVKKGTISEKRIDESVARIIKLKETFAPTPVKTRKKTVVRPHRKEEEKIAARSITLLRNRKALIPLKPTAKTLILEWGKTSLMEPVAREFADYLGDIEVEVLPMVPPDKRKKTWRPVPKKLEKRINEFDRIIAGVCSSNPNSEQLQAEGLNRILQLHQSVIVAAIGNPYDIRNFPTIDTYVVTYGYRKVQLEALFKVLTGKIEPVGRLPVQIKNLFPRGGAALAAY
jgi:beta-N-acetylhexosaminidase